MKCCENVILTLRLAPSGKELDMELPAFLPVENLCDRLLETLRVLSPAGFECAALSLQHNGRTLEGAATLASAGLWDGSMVEIIAKGGEAL